MADQASMVTEGDATSLEWATDVARRCFGVEGRLERMTGECDDNFRLVSIRGDAFVLKISHPRHDESIVDLTVEALLHVARTDPAFPCPSVIPSREGRFVAHVEDHRARRRAVRLLSWLDGMPLRSARRSPGQRVACAKACARLGGALRAFRHGAGKRPLIWDLRNFREVVALLDELPDDPSFAFVRRFADEYAVRAGDRFETFRQQIVHNDMNANNVMIDPDDHERVIGVIDFGDLLETALAADVAIAASAQVTEPETAASDVGEFVAAYHREVPLRPEELAAMNWLVAARLLMDCVVPAWHRLRNPDSRHFARVDGEFIRRRVAAAERLMHAARGAEAP